MILTVYCTIFLRKDKKGLKDIKKQDTINKLLKEQVLYGAKLYTGEPFVDFSNQNLKYKFKSGVGLANKYIASFWYRFKQYSGEIELPKNPDDLLKEGWKKVTDPRNTSGSRDFINPKTEEKVRFDPGKSGANGWEGKDHYHRLNPNSTGKKDYYLDVYGNPVPRGSNPSHIQPK